MALPPEMDCTKAPLPSCARSFHFIFGVIGKKISKPLKNVYPCVRNESDYIIAQRRNLLTPSHLHKSALLHDKRRYSRSKSRRLSLNSWASWQIGMGVLESIEHWVRFELKLFLLSQRLIVGQILNMR
jgi:hypothetical protein